MQIKSYLLLGNHKNQFFRFRSITQYGNGIFPTTFHRVDVYLLIFEFLFSLYFIAKDPKVSAPNIYTAHDDRCSNNVGRVLLS